ncbi:MAG: undecaprenyl-diphosphate phosphatase [Actinomycetota bacterium]
MLEAIFLGIIQGLTEFLPISSSAHIRLIGEFLPSAQDPGATFTAIMQIGTEVAVLLFFSNQIRQIIKAGRLRWLIVLGSIPIFVLGYFGQEFIRSNFRSLWLIAATLILFGAILGFLDYKGRNAKTLEDLGTSDGLWYGIAQSLALVPGVSRSGATIAMGRLLGYRREDALRYSFLLAIPAVLGSGAYELLNSFSKPTNVFSISETLAATFTAFIVGYIVIAWLMKFVQTRSFMPFVVYRVALGTLILILLSTGTLTA